MEAIRARERSGRPFGAVPLSGDDEDCGADSRDAES